MPSALSNFPWYFPNNLFCKNQNQNQNQKPKTKKPKNENSFKH